MPEKGDNDDKEARREEENGRNLKKKPKAKRRRYREPPEGERDESAVVHNQRDAVATNSHNASYFNYESETARQQQVGMDTAAARTLLQKLLNTPTHTLPVANPLQQQQNTLAQAPQQLPAAMLQLLADATANAGQQQRQHEQQQQQQQQQQQIASALQNQLLWSLTLSAVASNSNQIAAPGGMNNNCNSNTANISSSSAGPGGSNSTAMDPQVLALLLQLATQQQATRNHIDNTTTTVAANSSTFDSNTWLASVNAALGSASLHRASTTQNDVYPTEPMGSNTQLTMSPQRQHAHNNTALESHTGNFASRPDPRSAISVDVGLTRRPPIALYIQCDDDSLSEFQCLVRQKIELFEAGQEDIESNAQGRNRPIVLGQVGIRCRCCTMLPPKHRARGAVYYPAKLYGIYQAAQNMASGHLCEHCQHVPDKLRRELIKLRDRKSAAGGGKKYWADGVRVLGVYEDKDGLRFQPR